MPKWGQWCSAVDKETETGSAWKRLGELDLCLSRKRVGQSAGILRDYDEGGEIERETAL